MNNARVVWFVGHYNTEDPAQLYPVDTGTKPVV